jgi:energy-coupling factor transporter ATP-binding protein EcfA2
VLTNLKVKNFKRLHDVEIELGKTVVFIGPNNSGKTTALQALALWEIGLRKWNEKRSGKEAPEKRPGVTINRRDLIAIPVPDANLLWGDLRVRDARRVWDVNQEKDKQETRNVRIDITVSGVTEGNSWECGLEFDYANEESFYCRPLRVSEAKQPERMPVPSAAAGVHMAFLPPMSGLAASETRLDTGAVNVRIGEGRTAEVLRNLCYQISSREEQKAWKELSAHISKLFGVDLNPPLYVAERGEVTMTYRERSGTVLDLSSSGRGLQQTLLLLAHLYAHPGTVLLLDEPDAHLEILRQREMYQFLTEIADAQGSQVIAASHSEVILNEAAERDMVVAFVGQPHRIDDRGSQVLKALRAWGFEQYYQAEQTGWVLYLEGATDLAILQAFAERLGHAAGAVLERPFVRYVQNQPSQARDHFYALREAKTDLVGFALFDRITEPLRVDTPLTEVQWQRREIENYFCYREILLDYARCSGPDIGPLFNDQEAVRRQEAMGQAINEVGVAMRTLGKPDLFSPDVKASDECLDPVFRIYFDKLGLRNLMQKSDYHLLAKYVPRESIDTEVVQKLDAIVRVAETARPRSPGV